MDALFYTSNAIKLKRDNQGTIDLVRDLNLSQNTLLAEIFAGA